MTILGKKQMSEEDIKLNYITPVILNGWKGHITMETKITDGRINISGNIVARSKPKFADYMLYLNDGKPIAVVEAKDNNHSVSHGLQQAMTYAQMMDLPFAYSSNGDAFYEHDFLTGQEQQIALEEFPTQEMIGKLGILEIPVTTNQACCACIPYAGMYNKYLFYYLMSMRQTYIGMAEGGAQPNISKEKIVNSILPLPPLEEQHRIVAKLEEILPLCERLK